MTTKPWEDSDKRQVGTLYWTAITASENQIQSKLIRLLNQYPIEYPGKEFIMRSNDAIQLLVELETLGIAANHVTVWCYIPIGVRKENCCPDGFGGPGRFREYIHLGFSVPDFDKIRYETDLASKCNPLVRGYIEFQLPKEPGFSEYIRVTPHLYVPLMWNLFPD